MAKLLNVARFTKSQVVDVAEFIAQLEVYLNHDQANTYRHVQREGCEVDTLKKKMQLDRKENE